MGHKQNVSPWSYIVLTLIIGMLSVALLNTCQPTRKASDYVPDESWKQVEVDEDRLLASIAASEDLAQNRDLFMRLSKELVQKQICHFADFEHWGGWVRSTEYDNAYFTHCGRDHLDNKVVLLVQAEEYRLLRTR